MASIRDDQASAQSHEQRAQGHGSGSFPQSATGEQSSFRVRSCITCRQRKVKCDKLLRCTGCRKSQFECFYPPTRTPTHQAFDTALPLNINDDSLDPDSTTIPSAVDGITDMTMPLMRYEIINGTGRRQQKSSLPDINLSNDEADQIIQECNDKLQIGYLRHCDSNVPFQWFTATFARMLMEKMWINILHRFQLSGGVKVLPASCKDRIFKASLEIVELCLMLEREESTRQWRWSLKNYIPWQTMVFLLCQICQREKTELVDRAWTVVQDAFLLWGKVAADKKQDVLWANLNKLMAKARASRSGKDSGSLYTSTLSPSPGAVNAPAAGSEDGSLWNTGTGFDMTSNLAPESWLGYDPQLAQAQPWWYDDLGNLDNWVTWDWSGFNEAD